MRTTNKLQMRIPAQRFSNMPGCKGKQQFLDEAEAIKALERYKASCKFDDTMTYYQCPSCSKYHLGHPRPQATAPEVDVKGRFLLHEGVTFAKLKDPTEAGSYWVFAVPVDTEETEIAVLEKGVLVARKRFREVWLEKDDVQSRYHNEFYHCPALYYNGPLADFIERMEYHKEHMGDIHKIKMDLLNGQPMPVPEKLTKPVPVPLKRATPHLVQETHKGRPVLRDEKNRPYHRTFLPCAAAGCDQQIELRAYIAANRSTGELTTVYNWQPVEPEVTQSEESAGRSRQWLCSCCSQKQPDETAQRAAVPSQERQVEILHHSKSEPASQPTWTPSVDVLHELRKLALNGNCSAEFVRGATLMACELLLSGQDEAA